MFISCFSVLFAHPHTFISTRIEIVFSEESFDGFWIDWEFDPVFTNSVVSYYDLDKNGEFSDKEKDQVFSEAFSNLENYNYFTRIFSKGKEYPVAVVENFIPYIKNDLLCYRFFIPFEIPIPDASTGSAEKLSIAIFDETYFCAVEYFQNDPVLFSKPDNIDVKYSFKKNVERKIEYPSNDAVAVMGITYPMELILNFTRAGKNEW